MHSTTSVFVESKSAGLNDPAGIVFGDDGLQYVASRNSKDVLRYGGMTVDHAASLSPTTWPITRSF